MTGALRGAIVVSGPADAFGEQHGERDQEQQPSYAGGDGPVTISGVAAGGEGDDG